MKPCRILTIKSGENESKTIIKLSKLLDLAWDDLAAVGSIEAFSNVVTLRSLENKLPTRLLQKWIEAKTSMANYTTVQIMKELKKFIGIQRDLAETFLKTKAPASASEGKAKNPKGNAGKRFTGTAEEDNSHDSSCSRCGLTNHQIKTCRVPKDIVCRKCAKVGHIERACPKASAVKNGQKRSEGKTNEDRKEGKTITISDDVVSFVSTNVSAQTASGVRLPIEEVSTNFGKCNILWDSGSMLNLVENSWASETGMVGKPYNLTYRVVDGVTRVVHTKRYELDISTRDGGKKKLVVYGFDVIMDHIEPANLTELSKAHKAIGYRHREGSLSDPSGKVRLLIGCCLLSDFPRRSGQRMIFV